MDSLHGILVFLRVAESGSLSQAARALGVSTSAVSAALARLEARLSVRLVNRTTRRLSLSAEGTEFYSRCKQIVEDLENAEQSAGQAGRIPSGPLRVGMPSALSRIWIVPHLPEFMRRYPSVTLEIVCSNFVPYTIDEGLDVSVQIGELQSSRLAVRRLASTRYVVCAAPRYIAERGVPQHPDDLASHVCLTYRRPRDGRIWAWRFKQGESVRRITVNEYFTANSSEALVAAAVAGMGVIQVADYYARSYLQDGSLVEVLSDYQTEGHIISAVYPAHQIIAPKTRVFVDFLAALFNSSPWHRGETPAAPDAPKMPRSVGNIGAQPAQAAPLKRLESDGHARRRS